MDINERARVREQSSSLRRDSCLDTCMRRRASLSGIDPPLPPLPYLPRLDRNFARAHYSVQITKKKKKKRKTTVNKRSFPVGWQKKSSHTILQTLDPSCPTSNERGKSCHYYRLGRTLPGTPTAPRYSLTRRTERSFEGATFLDAFHAYTLFAISH